MAEETSKVASTSQPAQDTKVVEERLKNSKKELVHLINLKIMDTKHRKLDGILDTCNYLGKIMNNVYENPNEEKYRKIRIANPAFAKHVRDVPGAEEFMITAGWRASVVDYERYFVFEATPDMTPEWQILSHACTELAKLKALIEGKINRQGGGDKKAEKQQQLEAIRKVLEDDKADRHLKYNGTVGSE